MYVHLELGKTTLSKAIKFKRKIYPFSEPRFEVVEDEVWILLRHVTDVRNIVTHYQIADGKVSGWAKGL